MKSEAASSFIFIALVLVCSSVFAENKSQFQPKEVPAKGSRNDEASTNGGGGTGVEAGAWGIGSNTGGFSGGFSQGGVYGGGQLCKWGCCSASYGYSHAGGGSYDCTCCQTAGHAKAYAETQARTQIKN